MSSGKASSALERAFKNLVAGVVCGFLAIVLSISFGSLLLPASMQPHQHAAIGTALFSSLVAALVSSLLSPFRGAVSVVQEIPLVAIAAVLGTVAARLAGHENVEAVFVTLIAATALASIATGVILILLGTFRLGRLVRFVPYPVIGGFLAGTGWLIFQGGLSVIAGANVDFGSLGVLAAPSMAFKGGAALVFILAVALFQKHSASDLVLPIASFAALVVFNIVALATGASTEELVGLGWLVPMPAGHGLWPPVMPADLEAIDWHAVAGAVVGLPGIVGITVMALLMNATAIELDSGRDVDLDGELRSVGLQSLIAGAGGGMPGYPAVSLTLLASRLGAPTRTVGLIVAGLIAATLLLGQLVLSLVPATLLGALLVFVGGQLMIDWLIRAAARLQLREYLIILLIFVVVIAVSFPFGILTGLIAAIALFVVEYGRVDTIRFVLRGSQYQSNIEGSEERRTLLQLHGDAILILRLQGYLFFGTAERLRAKILAEVEGKPRASVRFVVIDLQRVTGLDTSAALSFMRLVQAARRDGFMVVATGRSAMLSDALTSCGYDMPDGDAMLRFEPDIEQGLSWCEKRLLKSVAPEVEEAQVVGFDVLIKQVLRNHADVSPLAGYFERVEVAAGQPLIEENAPSDDMYFIERGHAAVKLEGPRGKLSIAFLGPGAVVGEIAFYRGRARTASVIAEDALVAWRLTRADLRRLEHELPAVAFRFHEGMAAMLAERLSSTNSLLRFFSD